MHYCDQQYLPALRELMARFGILVHEHPLEAVIPGSFWGEPEAGMIGQTLHVRADTPIHSAMHEACHIICMDSARREKLHTDAGGDDLEESAVCYLQVVLADALPNFDRARMMADMDAWGYSFRLGSTAAWFAEDAADAEHWLKVQQLLTESGAPLFRTRKTSGSRSGGAAAFAPGG